MIRRLAGVLVLAGLTVTGCSSPEKTEKKEAPTSSAAPTGRVALLVPEKAGMTAKAPAVYKVNVETSKGDVVVEVHRDWAPNAADRFHFLVQNGYYNDVRFFRVVSGFMVQFGISGDPKLNGVWRQQTMLRETSNRKTFPRRTTNGR